MHARDAGAERVGAGGEVLSGGGRIEGDPPGVLDALEELLGESERAAHRHTLGRHPRPAHLADRRGHERGAAGRESGLQFDVGVDSRVDLSEQLADDGAPLALRAEDQRGVRLLATQHPRGRVRRRGVPGQRDADEPVLSRAHFAADRHPRVEQVGEGRVGRGIRPHLPVGCGADQTARGHGSLGATGDRYLVDDRGVHGFVPHEQEVRLGPVERPVGDHREARVAALRAVPALTRHPEGKGFEEVAHAARLTRRPRVRAGLAPGCRR